MNHGFSKKNWQKIANFSDFIAIDLTINRHDKSRYNRSFLRDFDDMHNVIFYDGKLSLLSKVYDFWWMYSHPQKIVSSDDFIAIFEKKITKESRLNHRFLSQLRFIAIDLTINRPENRDKIVDFQAILRTWGANKTLSCLLNFSFCFYPFWLNIFLLFDVFPLFLSNHELRSVVHLLVKKRISAKIGFYYLMNFSFDFSWLLRNAELVLYSQTSVLIEFVF
jgi:hypothetical protein